MRTFIGLSTHPGQVAREYIAGHRRRYTNPLKYAFLTATLYALVMGLKFQRGSSEGTVDFLTRIAPVLPYAMFVLLLPMAFLQRWVLRRDTHFNSAECYVFLNFVQGHWFIVAAIMTSLGLVGSAAWFSVGMALNLVYLTWAVRQFHGLSLIQAALVALMLQGTANVLLVTLGLLIVQLR